MPTLPITKMPDRALIRRAEQQPRPERPAAALAAEQKPAQIVITVPRALKGAWVRQSRARGQKLTDWIVERVQRDA